MLQDFASRAERHKKPERQFVYGTAGFRMKYVVCLMQRVADGQC